METAVAITVWYRDALFANMYSHVSTDATHQEQIQLNQLAIIVGPRLAHMWQLLARLVQAAEDSRPIVCRMCDGVFVGHDL